MGADVEKGWGDAYQTEARGAHGKWTAGGARPAQPAQVSQGTGGQPAGHIGTGAPGGPSNGQNAIQSRGAPPSQSGGRSEASASGGVNDSTQWAHDPAARHQALSHLQEAQDLEGQIKDLRTQRAQLQNTLQTARVGNQSEIVDVKPGEGSPAEGSQQTWGQYVSGLLQQQQQMDLHMNELRSRADDLRQQAHLLMQTSKNIEEIDVAATLTGSGELTTISFPIEKTEETPDGNLIVYGKATDGSVDSDEQIVDPHFAGKAIQEWLDTGANLRVQHNAQRDPAGVGLEATPGPDGATWVKGLVVEPTAIRLVKHGALRAYSVGIARPTIERDRVARGGRITGGQIVEISLVDRPANKNCGIQLVKSDKNGDAEYTGKMFGDEDFIAKAAGNPNENVSFTPPSQTQTTMSSMTMPTEDSQTPLSDMDDDTGDDENVQKSDDTIDVVVKVNPMDVARMVAKRVSAELDEENLIKTAEAEFATLSRFMEVDQVVKDHREFSTDRRKELASRGHALPDGSYPIPDADALRRAAILARSGHGNASAAKRLIARRAKELGVANPLEHADSEKADSLEIVDKGAKCPVCNGTGKLDSGKACTKCSGAMKADGINQSGPSDNDTDSEGDEYDDGQMNGKAAKKGKKGKKGKKMPPWLQDGDDDDKSGDDKKAEKADAQDESEDDEEVFNHKSQVPTHGVTGQHSDPVPAHREPDGAFMEMFEESAHMSDGDHESHAVPVEMKAAMRLKSLNIPSELGKLHDLTCAAYTPEDVAKCYPSGGFSSIDEQYFAEKALNSASMDTLAEAANATMLWNHARTLKMIDPDTMVELQQEANKAFQDANPGPSSAPTPHEIHPSRFNRPYISSGHAAASPDQKPPHHANVPSGQIDASQFSRGYLDSGHSDDSPSNKGVGVPTSVDYVPTIKDNARQAMRAMHDHIAQTFPDVCPMHPDDHEGITGKPVPVPSGHGTPAASAVKEDADVDIIKGMNKKMRKKLGKKVLAGKMTVDEARSKIGRMNAQKTSKPAAEEMVEPDMAKGTEEPTPVEETPVVKADEPTITKAVEPDIEKGIVAPDLIKSMMEEKFGPLMALLEAQNERLTAQEKLIKKQNKALDNANLLLNSMADQPDPNIAPFKGMAQNPLKQASARPVGAQTVAEVAERTQAMMLRELETEFRTSPDPARREAAWQSMLKMRGLNQ
jgi:hypothetical protein